MITGVLSQPATPRSGIAMRIATRPHRTAAFTFVEVLAALMFLAIVIPALISALTLSNRASELTERGGAAAQLAQNKLNEMLLADAWQTGTETRGDFGADWPNYRWELTQNTWSTDSASGLTELKLDVFFKVQGNERSVTLTTLVNPPSATTTTGTTTGGTATP